MRVIRSYCPTLLTPSEDYLLPSPQRQHLQKVLRLPDGHPIEAFDAGGRSYQCTLARSARGEAVLRVGEPLEVTTEPGLAIHLGLVLSRGERLDYAVQKAVETGVAHITLLTSRHCEVRLGQDRLEKKIMHLQKIAIGACEQSGRCCVPNVAGVHQVTDWVRETKADLKLMAHATAADSAGRTGLPLPRPDSIALLVGPEGGWDSAELQTALAQGFLVTQLGSRVYRTETAPAALITALLLNYQDLQWRIGQGD